MRRIHFQRLANQRMREAEALYAARLYGGCYYLAGLAVECALKACIAKRTRRHEFPDKNLANSAWRHDLEPLLGLTELERDLEDGAKADREFDANWAMVKDWTVDSRYDHPVSRARAKALLDAVRDPDKGILPWLQDRW
jgi:HEPN domain-containing protein